jgi:hypothetical protein
VIDGSFAGGWIDGQVMSFRFKRRPRPTKVSALPVIKEFANVVKRRLLEL